jgi:thioredoxin 1
MSKSPAVNALIVVIVIAFVGGVAWFKSQPREQAAASVEPAAPPVQVPVEAAPQKNSAADVAPVTPPASMPRDAVEPTQGETAPTVEPLAVEPEPAQPPPADTVKLPAGGPPPSPAGDAQPDPETSPVADAAKSDETPATTSGPASPAQGAKLPRVVDLGADKCKACKELAPILVELRKEYKGRVDVDFIDVWKNSKAGEPYKIRVIPTQVFFNAEGKEVWRHEGFLPKKDFIAKFAELGVK